MENRRQRCYMTSEPLEGHPYDCTETTLNCFTPLPYCTIETHTFRILLFMNCKGE